MSKDNPIAATENSNEPTPSDAEFWRGHRITRVGGDVYIENEAGTEAFPVDHAEAYALAILAEIHQDEYRPNDND